MTFDSSDELLMKIDAGIKTGAALAIEEHRRMGRSIVVWRDGKVVIVPPGEIPIMPPEQIAARGL